MKLQKNILKGIYLLIFISSACNKKHYPVQSGLAVHSVKVMSYNIHHANPPSRADYIDVDAIARVIQKEQPALVALQEVDVYTKCSGQSVNEAAELAAKTGMKYYYFTKAIDYDGGDYGVAILSRFPLSAQHTYKLPTASGTNGEPRVLATVQISLPHNQKLVFACTHLDAQRSDTNRLLQITAIVDILQKEKLPVIIGGDFNAEPSGSVINVLDKLFKRTCISDCDFTIPVQTPRKTIDFIAYTPFDKFNTLEHKVIDEKYASDHLPVLATIQIK